jgi:hypothetical protein
MPTHGLLLETALFVLLLLLPVVQYSIGGVRIGDNVTLLQSNSKVEV